MKVALKINGSNKSAVQLEPDIIYRVGRKLGLEIHSDDETIELAHATIALTAGGVVRLSAVAGKVFVNGLETGNEIKSISVTDASNGLVDLRFGNVAAKLHFEDINHLDNEAAYDTSGFEDDQKDKSKCTTADSFLIPETEPHSLNTTSNGESFVIPETQAPNLNRSLMVTETPAVNFNQSLMLRDASLVDDFLIPETQDVLLNINNPIQMEQNENSNTATEDEISEMGTQIRICTQDFNEFDEDAIDDFDSSILLGDLPQLNHPNDKADAADLEMSALNWSASNSKCTAVNSTKSDDVSMCANICLTPELSVAGQRSEDVPCTPDIFDMFDVAPNESVPEPNEATDVNSESNQDDTQKLSEAKLPAVASIETPEATPREKNDDAHDINPSRNTTSVHSRLDDSNDSMQEFLEMQAFVKAKHLSLSKNTNEDPIQPQPSVPQPNENGATRLSVTAQVHTNYEDFIETQIFPGRSPINFSMPHSKGDKTPDILLNNIEDFIETQIFPPAKALFSAPSPKSRMNLEDFIETQPFIAPTKTSLPKSNANSNNTTEKQNNIEDLIETQLFIPPTNILDETSESENIDDFLQVSVNLSMKDDLDRELKELINLSPMANTPTEYMQHQNYFKPDTDQISKAAQADELPNTSNSTKKDTKQDARNAVRKRSAALLASPQLSPINKKRSRQALKSATLPEEEATEIKTSTRTLKKSPTLPEETAKIQTQKKSPTLPEEEAIEVKASTKSRKKSSTLPEGEEAVEMKSSLRTRKRRGSTTNEETTAPLKKKKDQTTPPKVETATVETRPKRGISGSEQDVNERTTRGRIRKPCSESLEEPNTGSLNLSEDSIREVKVLIRRHNLNKSDNESPNSSKEVKEEKSKEDMTHEAEVSKDKAVKPQVAEVTKPVNKENKERKSKATDDKPKSRSAKKTQIDDGVDEVTNSERTLRNTKGRSSEENVKTSSKKVRKHSSEKSKGDEPTSAISLAKEDKLLAGNELTSSSHKTKDKASKDKSKSSSKKGAKDKESSEKSKEDEPMTCAQAPDKEDKLLAENELTNSSSKIKYEAPKEKAKARSKKAGKDINSSETLPEEKPTSAIDLSKKDKSLAGNDLTTSSSKIKEKAPKASSKKVGKDIASSETLPEEASTSANALAKEEKLLAKSEHTKGKSRASKRKVAKGKDINGSETLQDEETSSSASTLDKEDKLHGAKEATSSSSKTRDKSSKEKSKSSSKKVGKGKDKNSSETAQEEEPTTSASARKQSTRIQNMPKRDQLKDINDYMKKIKTAGQKVKVSLTMCNNAELLTVLSYLRCNVEIANDPLTCDALIMDKGERTYKFLIAIASNKPILSSRWLYSVKETRSITVQREHIFRDDKFEELFTFKPLSVLEKPSLLKGKDFMLGNDIQPNAKEMKAIIQCAGGNVYNRPPSIASNVRLYVVTSKNEKKLWVHLRNYTNVQYIKTEGVMLSLLQLNTELLDKHTLTF